MAAPRTSWTAQEDDLLRRAVGELGDGPGVWKAVAERVPGRTNKACRKRWLHSLSPNVKKTPWTKSEDDLLLKYYAMFSPPRWSFIAKHIPGRTDDACSKRYRESLDPALKKDGWTDEEDEKLVELAVRLGNRWTLVGQEMGRSGLACRNRWRLLERKARPKAARNGAGGHLPQTQQEGHSNVDSLPYQEEPQTQDQYLPSEDTTSSYPSNALLYAHPPSHQETVNSHTTPFVPFVHVPDPPPPPAISTVSSLSNALVPSSSSTHPVVPSHSRRMDQSFDMNPNTYQDQSGSPGWNYDYDDYDTGGEMDVEVELGFGPPGPNSDATPSASGSPQFPHGFTQGEVSQREVSQEGTPQPVPTYDIQHPTSEVRPNLGSAPQQSKHPKHYLSAAQSHRNVERNEPSPEAEHDPNPRPTKQPRLRRTHGRDHTRLSSHLPAVTDRSILPYACGHLNCWNDGNVHPATLFATAAELAEHKRMVHMEEDDTAFVEGKPYRCALEGCKKGWKNLNGIQYHLQISKAHFKDALGKQLSRPEGQNHDRDATQTGCYDGSQSSTTPAETPGPADSMRPASVNDTNGTSSHESHATTSSSQLGTVSGNAIPSTNLRRDPSETQLQATPTLTSTGTSTAAVNASHRVVLNASVSASPPKKRPYKPRPPKMLQCPHSGCTKVYKQKTGLQYHLEHGHPTHIAQLPVIPPALRKGVD